MDQSNAAWDAQFRLMCESYREQLPARIAELEQAWEALQESGWGVEPYVQFKGLLHRLSGTGSTFGFHAISAAARQLEQYLEREIAIAGRSPSVVHLGRLVKYLNAIKELALNPRSSDERTPTLTPRRNSDVLESLSSDKFIVIVESQYNLSHELSEQLNHFGYHVQCLPDLHGLTRIDVGLQPSAILLHTDLIRQEEGPALLMDLRKRLRLSCPLLFISPHLDLGTRLQSVRAGGCAFFPVPIDIVSLINKLDTLTEKKIPDPFRVLIVEDDPIMASYLSSILKHHGMITEVVTDPMQILQPLTELRPDLVLMDMYLQPDCDGLELAEVIRQVELYVNIPIIFISTEVDMERRLEVMRQGGGDDFLTKPILPQHLIQAVVTRAERSRHLSTFMLRDSLTGLLNHTRFKEHLSIETARAARQPPELALAILDIDHFKMVNDVHGHPAGDRILRSLARMLTQRLRKTDIIGRLGGEEFAIILPGTSAAAAKKVLDGLRMDFRALIHHSDQGEFHVTFSAGVVSSQLTLDAVQLSDIADKALYAAKHRGRNQVVLVHDEHTLSALD